MKAELTAAMDYLASDSRNVFVGYGLKHGRTMGTLVNVPESQLPEFTVAEGLMTSAAIGMSLTGLLPIVIFERFDFAMNAMDAIVNHLIPAEKLSRGEFSPAVIFRAIVGNKTKPNFTGPVHTQNFTAAFNALGTYCIELKDASFVTSEYEFARRRQLIGQSTVLVEFKDLL